MWIGTVEDGARMFNFLSKVLSDDELSSIEERVATAVKINDNHAINAAIEPILMIQSKQRNAANTLLRIVESGNLPTELALSVLNNIEQSYSQDLDIICRVGDALEEASDINFLNRTPPESLLFHRVVESLSNAAKDPPNVQNEKSILRGLATAGRMMARQYDDLTVSAYRRLVELDPEKPSSHYGLGLYYKTRGLFSEGMEANQKACSLSDNPVDSYEWNLGICATGANQGEIALEVWKKMGQNIEMGRFGLPEGGYPHCKVRLAERPLAERVADNDEPGLEETIWIERLSPCHGIVRSVLYSDLGVDYGDVVLIDGAPITYHKYGDKDIPVHPHLATLRRNGYQLFDFAGTQENEGELMNLSESLSLDTVIYSHSEQYKVLCLNCWNDPDIDHDRHTETQKHVVTGRIAAPPELNPKKLVSELDKAIADTDCSIYSPNLCEAAHENQRAEIEHRRFDMLTNN